MINSINLQAAKNKKLNGKLFSKSDVFVVKSFPTKGYAAVSKKTIHANWIKPGEMDPDPSLTFSFKYDDKTRFVIRKKDGKAYYPSEEQAENIKGTVYEISSFYNALLLGDRFWVDFKVDKKDLSKPIDMTKYVDKVLNITRIQNFIDDSTVLPFCGNIIKIMKKGTSVVILVKIDKQQTKQMLEQNKSDDNISILNRLSKDVDKNLIYHFCIDQAVRLSNNEKEEKSITDLSVGTYVNIKYNMWNEIQHKSHNLIYPENVIIDSSKGSQNSNVEYNSTMKPGAPSTLNITNDVKIQLVNIPSGKFIMGGGSDPDEWPLRLITISKSFYMGETEVTQLQYETVMDINPSQYINPLNPVERVLWKDAVEFCKRLSEKTGKIVRLPTEAEWEYACKAGTESAYSYYPNNGSPPKDDDSFSWNVGNSGGKARSKGQRGRGLIGSEPHNVGLKKANPWGLYDIHGNVYEWCSDLYASWAYSSSDIIDPKPFVISSYKTPKHAVKGASWLYGIGDSRSTNRKERDGSAADGTDIFTGFRIVVNMD
jgi:formylglycine-generating enzyme required for sulfatase activity